MRRYPAQDVADHRLARSVFLRDGFVLVRVERLAERVDALDAGLLERAEELGVHQLDALADLLVRVHVVERELEAVEHGQELLDQPLVRTLDERGLLAQHALAVVLEIGLDALRELAEAAPSRRTVALHRLRRRSWAGR